MFHKKFSKKHHKHNEVTQLPPLLDDEPEVTGIQSLPPELLLHTFSFLNSYVDRVHTSAVCRTWNQVAEDSTLPPIAAEQISSEIAEHRRGIESLRSLLEMIRALLVASSITNLKVGIVGVGKTKDLLRQIRNPHKLNCFSMLQENDKEGLKACDLFIFCPDESEDRNINTQLKEFRFQLKHWLNIRQPIIFVMNRHCDINDFYSVPLRKHDSLSTLYSRMLGTLEQKQGEILASIHPETTHKPDGEGKEEIRAGKHRGCILS